MSDEQTACTNGPDCPVPGHEMTRLNVREARKVVNEHECRMRGHSWDVIESLGRGPTGIVCSRCGKAHRIVIEDAVGERDA